MNFFVEGLQGSGKSTMVRKLFEFNPDYSAIREGEYSPVELSWCAYVNNDQYEEILKKHPGLRSEIEGKTYSEGNRKIICYTKIATDNRAFYQDLERYEIYNNRVSFDDFRSIVLERYRKWASDKMIFECSIFQNIAAFRGTCKGMFFLIQNLHFLESGSFAVTKQDLKEQSSEEDRAILEMAELPDDFDYDMTFRLVFDWCQSLFNRVSLIQ